jgi:hypothetical protein
MNRAMERALPQERGKNARYVHKEDADYENQPR